ncbi:metallophosphoesterase, partial [Cutibacterium acnes]
MNLKWREKRDYTIFFSDGNHENFDILEKYPVEIWNGGKIHRICDNVFHLMRGQVFTILNKKIFTFGGALSIDKHLRTEKMSWWPRERPSNEKDEEGLRNLKNHNDQVDIIITHTCSSKTLYNLPARIFGNTKPQIDNLNRYFDKLENSVDFKLWVFGHFHIDLEVDDRHVVLYQ